jgi:hypothetical protein
MPSGIFDSFKPSWWDAVSSRAMDRTFGALSLGMEPLLFSVFVFLVVTAVSFVTTGLDATSKDFFDSLRNGVVFAVVFLGWYALNAFRSARDIYEEQQATIIDLETALARRVVLTGVGAAAGTSTAIGVSAPVVTSPPSGDIALQGRAPTLLVSDKSLADRLVQFRVDGVKLRNEIVKAEELDPWKARVSAWTDAVSLALKNPSVNIADRARFVTLESVPPLVFSWACNNKHNKHLANLTQRIRILLEIMAAL